MHLLKVHQQPVHMRDRSCSTARQLNSKFTVEHSVALNASCQHIGLLQGLGRADYRECGSGLQ